MTANERQTRVVEGRPVVIERERLCAWDRYCDVTVLTPEGRRLGSAGFSPQSNRWRYTYDGSGVMNIRLYARTQGEAIREIVARTADGGRS